MKTLKIIIPLLAFVLILSFLPACNAEEPEVTIEPAVEQTAATEPADTEETIIEEKEEVVEQK